MLENYHEPEELLSDESFLDWYFRSRTAAEAAQVKEMERWMAAEPGRRELIEQAVKLLDTTRIEEKELPEEQINAAESALMKRIGETPQAGATHRIGDSSEIDETPRIPAVSRAVILRRRYYWITAAAVLLVIFISEWAVRRVFFAARPEMRTEYGQIGRQQLPDGTEVVMNANSSISWAIGSQDGPDREVWLKGEAFFHVRKTPLKSRFIVHTDHFDIQVTGTQFDVVNRPSRDNILLREGSVILHAPDGGKLNMVPGDFVEFDGSQLQKMTAADDSLTAWKDQKLKLNNTSLRTLATIINEQYGVDVKLEDDATGDKTISGILSNNNLDVLLKALELTEKFDVVRKDGTILIKSHSPQKGD
jgi:ferric-dicitrate binding protein FerR (iron transport regulator)